MSSIAIKDVLPAGWESVLHPHHPRIGLGLDLATTEKKTSNPSSLTVAQQVNLTYFFRLILRWKTADPNVTRAILRAVIDGLAGLGLRGRRLCIDATSERFFATDLRNEFAGIIPVDLVIQSEKTKYGGEDMTFKSYLGNLLVNTLEDGYVALPGDRWVSFDFRQVVRTKGTFDAEVAEDGGHADCFDSGKLALHALVATGGPVAASGMAVGTFSAQRPMRPGIRNPYASQFERGPRMPC